VTSLLISLIIGNLNNALAAESSVALQKGSQAPFSGILISEEVAQQTRRDVIELVGQRSINESLNKSLQLQDLQIQKATDQIQLLEHQNKRLYDSLQQDKSMNNYERVLWFGLGVIGTGAAVYGAGKLLR